VLLTASCGAPLMKLPAGPGAPAPDAVEAFTEATAACRGVRTLTAEIAASGKVDGQRFRVRLSTGVAAPGSARVEAVAPFGPPIFILVADNDDATTLLLPRDDRVLRQGRSAEVLDAVAGVPISAADLRLVLTGCASQLLHPEGVALGAIPARRYEPQCPEEQRPRQTGEASVNGQAIRVLLSVAVTVDLDAIRVVRRWLARLSGNNAVAAEMLDAPPD
jgi:hypothetical protein